jgi:hypothetical protein
MHLYAPRHTLSASPKRQVRTALGWRTGCAASFSALAPESSHLYLGYLAPMRRIHDLQHSS